MTRSHILICAALLGAVAAYSEAPKDVTPGSIATYTATSANVSGAPDEIRIDILRWSTDSERDRLMGAWNLKTTSTGRGGGAAPARAGRAGRGAGAATESGPPPTPEAMLDKALKQVPTVGYLWSREVAGYAIRFAGRIKNPDGSERIVLVTDRKLGAVNDLWKPASGEPSAYDFSVIELHMKADGEGEGRTSLTGKVAADPGLKMVALDGYDSLPVVLNHVQRLKGSKE